MQDRLYHDLMLPEEAQEIRAEVRQFSEKELAPIAHDIGQQEEAGENFPHELFSKMARAGLFRIPLAKRMGDGIYTIRPVQRLSLSKNWPISAIA